MTSQLAQINTVTGISQLNTTLSSLATQMSAGQQSQAALLIGSTVLAPGSSVAVSSGKAGAFGVQLANAVGDLQVVVKNSAGQIVNTIDLGAQSAGTMPVRLDADRYDRQHAARRHLHDQRGRHDQRPAGHGHHAHGCARCKASCSSPTVRRASCCRTARRSA